MPRPLRFLFTTYRWGADFAGGAELHHRRLAIELAEAGHLVEAWTTTAHEFRAFAHWGALWHTHRPAGTEMDGPVTVRRFPASPQPKFLAAGLAKAVQADWERRVAPRIVPEATRPPVLLGARWHEPELQPGGAARRWIGSGAEVWFALPEFSGPYVIELWGHAPWPVTVEARAWRHLARAGRAEFRGAGAIHLRIECTGAPTRLDLRVRGARRPVRDHRELGVMMDAVRATWNGGEHLADLFTDARAYASDDTLIAAAQARAPWTARAFDWLRGPTSPARDRALAGGLREFDVVVACNYPWRVAWPPRTSGGPLRALMPLMHAGDTYYYWPHYFRQIAEADLVVANTPWSAQHFFPRWNPRASFVGPPIWPGTVDAEPPARTGGEATVLTVCRKSPEKKWHETASAVARLRERGVPVRFVGVGPDVDHSPVPGGGEWRGRLMDGELAAQYRAADIFALMSESESFGMVVVEAWHAGLPVIVNRRCRPAASLVEDGVDGLLAEPGAELDAAIEALAADPERRARMGAAGRAKARRDFVRGSAAARLVAALEPLIAARG